MNLVKLKISKGKKAKITENGPQVEYRAALETRKIKMAMLLRWGVLAVNLASVGPTLVLSVCGILTMKVKILSPH
jgi:hypothetical protein